MNMAAGSLRRALRGLCRAVGPPPEGLTDGQLLERYALRGDEVAFEALVLRHGRMVLGVCRRVLRHEQDAEDAFQATFLVLARRAASLEARQTVGGWLHGVAHRTALEARRAAIRRRAKEARAVPRQGSGEGPEVDLWPVLDRELVVRHTQSDG
jgi:RNA polymerase sigma-70 factor (ECF subfamily)